MSLRSMTGFARVRRTIGEVDVVLSVKTVNHRGLDIHFHTPSDLDPFEAGMRSVVKRLVGRGHVDLRAQLTRPPGSVNFDIDRSRLDAWVNAFRELSEHYGLSAPVDLNAALRLPGILGDSGTPDLPPDFGPQLIDLLEESLGELNTFREREGAELATVLLDRAASLLTTASEIERCRAGAFSAFETRLRDRLSDLFRGSSVDPQRVVQEAAILADRSDIGEEIERLRIHAGQVPNLVDAGSEAGKKLDFLFQEMNRETNTILSKTSGLGEHGLRITELAVAAKSDIEKMREQALNVE